MVVGPIDFHTGLLTDREKHEARELLEQRQLETVIAIMQHGTSEEQRAKAIIHTVLRFQAMLDAETGKGLSIAGENAQRRHDMNRAAKTTKNFAKLRFRR